MSKRKSSPSCDNENASDLALTSDEKREVQQSSKSLVQIAQCHSTGSVASSSSNLPETATPSTSASVQPVMPDRVASPTPTSEETTATTNDSSSTPNIPPRRRSSNPWGIDFDLNWLDVCPRDESSNSEASSGSRLPSLSMLNEWVRNPTRLRIGLRDDSPSDTTFNNTEAREEGRVPPERPRRRLATHTSASDTQVLAMRSGNEISETVDIPDRRTQSSVDTSARCNIHANNVRFSVVNEQLVARELAANSGGESLPVEQLEPIEESAGRSSGNGNNDGEVVVTASGDHNPDDAQNVENDGNEENPDSPMRGDGDADGHSNHDNNGRNNNARDILRQSSDIRLVITVLGRYFPFLIVLLMKCMFDHGAGIICFLALLITFGHTNGLFKKEVAKQAKRSLFYLLMIVVNMTVCVAFLYYVFHEEALYNSLIYMRTNIPISSFWVLLWVVAVNDYVIKFATIVLKVLVLTLPEKLSHFRRRGRFYLFIENTSQLYRSTVTTLPWICYLDYGYTGNTEMFGYFLTAIYILCKAVDIGRRLNCWRIAFTKMVKNVQYGVKPTAEEVDDGALCPICHDAFNHPTKLTCGHIFCEDCVATWFDRERTCPLCRSKVVDDPSYRDGSTTHFLQLY